MRRTGTYTKPMDGWCRVCGIYVSKIPYFDLDLNGPVCQECIGPDGIAELILKSCDLNEPTDQMITENP